MHIIFDAFYIPFKYFPKNYIVFQTLDLDEVPLTKSYLEKLKNAVAIWDPSWKNITKYSLLCENYLHFSEETFEALVLPCLIPADLLADYKEVLIYSNAHDTDISSHLPTLFAHCAIKRPELAIEVGVRSGESTYALHAGLSTSNGRLIGIDVNDSSAKVYEKRLNSEFIAMNDLNFQTWWKNSRYRDIKADLIFIDTSHHYDHTMKELEIFTPLLNREGLLAFHDTHMCPLPRNGYKRMNNTYGIGWDNKKGVTRAIKDFFSISFDEGKQCEFNFSWNGSSWILVHYPYCNGLTLIKLISSSLEMECGKYSHNKDR
ncbi:MAG TPA: class I SAM-dependent methyltransferase [Chlamydiales bacterium]|nr:class I SAM-dependent methyltransferase [Chlamydiales bacterium]